MNILSKDLTWNGIFYINFVKNKVTHITENTIIYLLIITENKFYRENRFNFIKISGFQILHSH